LQPQEHGAPAINRRCGRLSPKLPLLKLQKSLI
jgi:hypothetical protein